MNDKTPDITDKVELVIKRSDGKVETKRDIKPVDQRIEELAKEIINEKRRREH